MYAKRIIPCLDVKNGRVVKGMSFVNLVDAGDPVECAKQYDAQGADELVFLDITASSDSRNITIDMVEKVADSIFIPFTVGGGIRSVDDFNALLRAGADKVSVNSAAVHRPELISEAAYKFGSQCVVAAIDAKRSGDSWEVTLTAAELLWASTPLNGRFAALSSARARFCSQAWTRTARKRAMTSS